LTGRRISKTVPEKVPKRRFRKAERAGDRGGQEEKVSIPNSILKGGEKTRKARIVTAAYIKLSENWGGG